MTPFAQTLVRTTTIPHHTECGPATTAHNARLPDRRGPAHWLDAQLARLSDASELARHIKYALRRWNGLTRFLRDGRVEMDTNPVENAIRPIPLTRKNALFAGRDDGTRTWAQCASLLGTCKLNAINPQTYLTVTLRRIGDM